MLDFFIQLLGLASKAEPMIAEWVHSAIAANPDHPISRRVKDVMPEHVQIHDVVDALERK